MAVASDLPSSRTRSEFQDARATRSLVDDHGQPLGDPDRQPNRVLVALRRDLAGHAARDHRDRGPALLQNERRRPARHRRARSVQDVVAAAAPRQGGSTITQQFVKNALAGAEQPHGLREAARGRARLPPHAQVVEGEDPHATTSTRSTSATAPTGSSRPRGPTSATTSTTPAAATPDAPAARQQLQPGEAALLAGDRRVARARYDPVAHPVAAHAAPRPRAARRCSSRATSRGRSTTDASRQALPDAEDDPAAAERRSTSVAPLLHDLGAASRSSTATARARAFDGGLQIKTTLDLDLQQAAEQRGQTLPRRPRRPDGVAGGDRQQDRRGARDGRRRATTTTRPFNLATQGQRQPGSAFKPFVLAAALQARHLARLASGRRQAEDLRRARHARQARSSSSTTTRAPTPASRTLARRDRRSPTTRSTPRSGIKVGTQRIARLAQRMGIRTPVSTNPAMTLGGLKQGVTPLDMAHAYETFAARRPARQRHARRRRRRPGRHPARSTPAATLHDGDRRDATSVTTDARAARERRRDRDARSSRRVVAVRHRRRRRDRRVRGRQDRHDRELRRRLVRRLERRSTRSPSGSATPTSSSR